MDVRRFPLYVAAILTLTACGSAPPTLAVASPTPAPAVILPLAWTATPSATPVPETPTPSPTLHPAVFIARQTASPWPPLGIVAVGAGADTAGWQLAEFPSASLLLPPGFRSIEPRRFDSATRAFLQDLSVQQSTGLPESGTATPLGSLEDFQNAYGFDYGAADNSAEQLSMFIVGGPRPEAVDLETRLTEAAGLFEGEVEVSRREIVGGAAHPTGRLLLRSFDRARGTVEDFAIYAVSEGERAWTLIFQAQDFDQFTELLPTFESIALSLTPKP
jgi:hypothetical protein